MAKIDLTGYRSGRLVAIEPTNERDSSGCVKWKCQCDCGNIIVVSGTRLRLKNRAIQSCGCIRKEKFIEQNKRRSLDLTNQRFGNLLALRSTNKRNNNKSIIWLCQCDCGKKCEVDSSSLVTGNTKSCGCQRNKSYGEQKIAKILNDNMIFYEREKSFADLKYSDSDSLARYDFYLPEYNCLIEFDGIQHFQSGFGNFDNPEKFFKTQKHDNIKNQYAIENKIILIRIPYTHYENISLFDLLPTTSSFVINKNSPLS